MSEEIYQDDEKSIKMLIKTFYDLKTKYDQVRYTSQVLPIVRSKASKKEKCAMFGKLTAPECVNCKRKVGTIFSIKVGGEDGKIVGIGERQFTAKCGDTRNPCPLNIRFTVSDRRLYKDEIRFEQSDINKYKENIIELKNNDMFGFGTNEEKYDENFEFLENSSVLVGVLVEDNNKINNSVERRDAILKIEGNLKANEIPTYKTFIDEYKKDGDESLVDLAVNQYIQDILPLTTELRSLKNDENFVDFDKESYTLIQRPSLTKGEFFDAEGDKILSNVSGVYVKEQEKKTIKIRSKKSTSKTRRVSK